MGEGPFSVFATTDDAFGLLPEGTVEGLLEDLDTLGSILLYHVVEGKVMAADVVELADQMGTTPTGEDLEADEAAEVSGILGRRYAQYGALTVIIWARRLLDLPI